MHLVQLLSQLMFSFWHSPWQIIKMYSFLDYIMGGCQIQFTVSFLTFSICSIITAVFHCLCHAHSLCVHVCVSVPGGNRLHSLQRGSQKQLLPPLHPPLPAQRVPQSSGSCGGDLPRLWQVEAATPSVIVWLILTHTHTHTHTHTNTHTLARAHTQAYTHKHTYTH